MAGKSTRSNDAGIDPLVARDLAVLWHPCSQMRDYQSFAPLHVVGAEGCRIKLADGREVYDAISSWWCKNLGHGHPRLRAALAEQASQFEHVILANTTNEPIVRFCERILALANGGRTGGFGKVFFAGDGSVGVEVALKMALQAQAQRGQPQRTRFAAFENGYHGETIATLSVGDCGLYGDPYRALMFPTTIVRGLPYVTGNVNAWADLQDLSAAQREIETQLAPLADTLAAIVYEPVLQAAGGMRMYDPAVLVYLRRWADAHGVYLIADEIATGMGRIGPMLASHLAEAMPDFAVMGKGLTAGWLPMSIVLTTDAVYDLFDAEYHERRAFLHSNTFAGNALAVAVANAVLDEYEQSDVLARAAANVAHLQRTMTSLAVSRPYLHDVRGIGMVAAVDIRQRDGTPFDPMRRTGYRVYQEAVRRGALLRPLGDTMYLFPPLNCTGEEIEAMVAILGESLDAVVKR